MIAEKNRCLTGAYVTTSTLTVAGVKGRGSSRSTFIECDVPADNRCEVQANAPRATDGQIIGTGSFKCRSDQPNLIWSVSLQEQNGGWQPAGFRRALFNTPNSCWRASPSCAANTFAAGGQSYNESVPQPCANEAPPWPQDFRTVIEIRRVDGPAITETSVVASLSCPSPPATLRLVISGGGAGTVTSSPAGIDCAQSCSHSFDYGSTVTLTATPAAGSHFAGWKGPGCSGTGTCDVTMNGDQVAVADFESG
jgi:hypothetical protein